MNNEDFTRNIQGRFAQSEETLIKKAKEYATDVDRLHTFKVAAELQGMTVREALGGMMAKHVVSVYDLIRQPELASPEVWDEKLGDNLNYLLLLSAVVEDERSQMQPSTMASEADIAVKQAYHKDAVVGGEYWHPGRYTPVHAQSLEEAQELLDSGWRYAPSK